MYYIHAISSITHQNTFRIDNIIKELSPIKENSNLISPDYKEFIPGAALRRLSPVLRIGLTAAIDCKNKIGEKFDAISVGTALGCLRDTEKFLKTFHTSTSDFISPTSFIQSTHNTIAGQISLGLKNHAYNMTHTQNNLSFEMALIDAIMCINEGKINVLVGSADEKTPFLELLQPKIISKKYPLSTGGSFFSISKTKNKIGIIDVKTIFNSKNTELEIKDFLKKHKYETKDIDAILHSDSNIEIPKSCHSINFLKYSGLYYSASSFALHFAHDYLISKNKNSALIVNDICIDKVGLILIKSNEA